MFTVRVRLKPDATYEPAVFTVRIRLKPDTTYEPAVFTVRVRLKPDTTYGPAAYVVSAFRRTGGTANIEFEPSTEPEHEPRREHVEV